MLTYLARRRIDAFQKKHSYDMAYAREILELSPRAMLLYSRATQLGTFRAGLSAEVHTAAKVTALLHEDCGPCVQLAVDLGAADGVPAPTLRALLDGDMNALSTDCALAVQLTRAVLNRSPEADPLREQFVRRFGRLALVSFAFTLTTSRIYPTVKYALGYGKACTRVTVGRHAPVPHLPLGHPREHEPSTTP